MLMLQGGTFGFIHDILVTDQHYVILENPIKMNFGKLLSKYAFAKACLAECLEYQPSKPTKIHVIKRPGKQSSVLGEFWPMPWLLTCVVTCPRDCSNTACTGKPATVGISVGKYC